MKLRHNIITIQLELNLNWIQIPFYFLKTTNEKNIQSFLVNMILFFKNLEKTQNSEITHFHVRNRSHIEIDR